MHLVDTFGKPNLEVPEQILVLNQRDFGRTLSYVSVFSKARQEFQASNVS